MTREERLSYCRICQYRKMSNEGLICRISNAKANFTDECPSFLVDEKKKESEKRRIGALFTLAEKEQKRQKRVSILWKAPLVVLGIGLSAVVACIIWFLFLVYHWLFTCC